jgi:oligoribonuclease (3'-5' exoribonuclease)
MTIKLCPMCERPLQLDPRYDVLSDEGREAVNAIAKCSCGWQGEFRFGLTEPRVPNPAPALPYVSIDIETTGLDPETCQILEIGAAFDNWTQPLSKLPTFHCYVTHRQIVGSAYALAMNAEILRKLANPQPTGTYLDETQVAKCLAAWLNVQCGWDGSKALTPAGKNFASFDRQFLKRLPDFEKKVRLHHRTLDPAMLFWQLGDEKLPDSQTCYIRAGIKGKVAHTALEDALAVVQLIRIGIKRMRPCQ